MTHALPLFPLSSLLFPHGQLELRLFEPRYLDMVSRCMRDRTGFGVVLLDGGSESGGDQSFFNIGTEAHIVDWDQGEDGLLHIRTEGARRFVVESSDTQSDQLVVAEVSWLPEPAEQLVPDEYAYLEDFLGNLADRAGLPPPLKPEHRGNASIIGYRLAELLPLDPKTKVELLASGDPIARLRHFDDLLASARQKH